MPRGPENNPVLASRAVPQANSLAKLRRLVEAVAAGAVSVAELQEQANLSPRHVRYYLLAAETLEWVETGAGSSPMLTARGRTLIATAADSRAETAVMANAIQESAVLGLAVGAYLTEHDAGVDELASRIARCTGLSPATSHRRAACLTTWRSQLEARGWRAASPAPPEVDPSERSPAGAGVGPHGEATAGERGPLGAEVGPDGEATSVERSLAGAEVGPHGEATSGERGPLGAEVGPDGEATSVEPDPPGAEVVAPARVAPDLSGPSGTEQMFLQEQGMHEVGKSQGQRDERTPPPLIFQPLPAFKYVTEDHAPVYRAIVQVFFAAKAHYEIELRPSDVEREIAAAGFFAPLAAPEALAYHLGKLVEWGNLAATHDTAAVATIEDFYKKSYVYHLTSVGEAAHRAVLDVEATVGRAGSLQSNMLLEIRDGLRDLAQLAAGEPVDPERALRLLHALFAAFDTLSEEAARFIGEVSQSFGAERIEEEQFVLRKHALVAYISRFVDQLRKLAAEIATGVRAVEASGVERLLAAAAASADLPPPLGHEDPRAAWRETQQGRWAGMRRWFCATGGVEPTVERLAGVAVEAILGLTRALGRLNARRTQPVDRQADYLTLAQWFAACATDREAHALYEAAFGLYGARHFHLAEDDPDLARPGESWWETAPVSVPASLRARGTVSHAGRPAAAPDHEASRAWIAQRQRREREQLESAQRRFAGRGELRLSHIARVSAAELDLLLALLDEALAAPRQADGSRSTRTADGRLTVTLRPPVDPAGWVELATPRGRLRCRDLRIEVTDARVAGAREAAS